MNKWLLYAGAAVNLWMAVVHALFWKTFHWETELSLLSPTNKGIMIAGNVFMIFFILCFAALSIMLAREKAFNRYARSILLMAAGFYLLRVAMGYPLFGLSSHELVIWITCGASALLYLIPFFTGGKTT